MPDEIETWKPVVDWEDAYEVSSLGRVRSLPRPYAPGGLLKTFVFRGYPTVSLNSKGRSRSRPVHVLVAAAFIGPRPPGHDIRHLDGTRLNSSVSNLAYGTRSENCHDLVRHGVHNHARKTHCPRGHEYTPENTRRSSSQPNARYCRACDAAPRIKGGVPSGQG